MALQAEMPLQEKQRLAALRTHGIRQKSTESKVRAACRRLIEAGEQLRVTAVARMAGISRQTIAAYKHVMYQVQNTMRAAGITKVDVKYGVHQISATLSPCLPTSLGSEGAAPLRVKSLPTKKPDRLR